MFIKKVKILYVYIYVCVCVCVTGNPCLQAIRVLTRQSGLIKKANIYEKNSIFVCSYNRTQIVQFIPSEYMQSGCIIFVGL